MSTSTHKVLLKQGALVLKQCKKALLERDMAVLQQQARILQVAALASRQTLIEAEARLLEQAAQQNQPRRAAEILMNIKACLVALAGDRHDFESLPGVSAETEERPKKCSAAQRPHLGSPRHVRHRAGGMTTALADLLALVALLLLIVVTGGIGYLTFAEWRDRRRLQAEQKEQRRGRKR